MLGRNRIRTEKQDSIASLHGCQTPITFFHILIAF